MEHRGPDDHSDLSEPQSQPHTSASTSTSARKRTRRACDRCSSLRVRCDGRNPCRRCQEYEQTCHYARKMGKRGRKPGSKRLTQPAGQEGNRDPEEDGDSASVDDHEGEHKMHSQENGVNEGRSRPENLNMDSHETSSLLSPTMTFTGTFTGTKRQIINTSSGRRESEIQSPLTTSLPQQSYFSGHARSLSTTLGSELGSRSTEAATSPYMDIHYPTYLARGSIHTSVPGFNEAPENRDGPKVTRLGDDPEARSARAPSNTVTTERSFALLKGCRYTCLDPIIPLLHGVIDASLASELLEMYFVEPGGSLFRCASPYVLTHVLRKESLLRAVAPRKSTPALLITMLWVSAQTAESSLFLLPGQKTRVCEELRKLMVMLIQERDRDAWERTTDGPLLRDDKGNALYHGRIHTDVPPPVPVLDDVLTYILLTIVVSGGDFKTDCMKWWNKTLRLSNSMGLNRDDELTENHASCSLGTMCTGASSTCPCRECEAVRTGLSVAEVREERRRVFWLIFCLDRHLALSFNSPLRILDDECQLYAPLPDEVWESLEPPFFDDINNNNDQQHAEQQSQNARKIGAPTQVFGIGFFEYFLPLMTILGDVIQLHRKKCHPRFGSTIGTDDCASTALVEHIMDNCEQSIADLATKYEVEALDGAAIPASQVRTPTSGVPVTTPQYPNGPSPAAAAATALPRLSRSSSTTRKHAQAQLVTAYSSFILHVLRVLLHGKWDAVSMLDNKDGWIPSVGFMKCASHAVAASDAVSRILACDPELSFMPYLFGIYLLHGSFILLLFADRMPQIGLNESVERACEIIIRAHEVCVVTLSTEFQKRFRKVLRSTLYSVRSAGTSNVEESKARRRALSLYRWSNGSTGLAL